MEENSPVISSGAPSTSRNKVPPDINNDVDFFEDSNAMETEQGHEGTEVLINTQEDQDDIPCNQQQAILLETEQAPIMERTSQERTNRKQQLTLSGHLDLSSTEKGFQNTCSLNQQQMPPTNFTLESRGKRTVILIKCTDPNSVKLINNPIEIHKSVSNSVFGSLSIADVRVNKRKQVIVIEITDATSELLQSLTTVTKLGNWNVNCYIPRSDSFQFGVIAPISQEVDLDTVMEYIKTSNGSQIKKLVRLKKRIGVDWVDSSAIKILVINEELPQSVTIAHSFYKVRPFVSEPLQCYRCQRLGHTSTGCTAKVRCLLCGEEHSKEVCSKSNKIKCANCKGDHRANSKECLIISRAMEIESLKVEKRLTHSQARTRIMSLNKINSNQVQEQLSPERTQVSSPRRIERNQLQYRDVLMRTEYSQQQHTEESLGKTTTVKQMIDQGTQTEEKCMSLAEKEANLEIMNEQFFEKLKGCLLELLKSNILKENEKTKNMRIAGAFRNYFGVSLGKQGNVMRNKTAENRNTDELEKTRTDTVDEDVLSNSETESETDHSIWETVEKTVRKSNKEQNTSTNGNNNKNGNKRPGRKRKKVQK